MWKALVVDFGKTDVISHDTLVNKLWKYKFGQKLWVEESSMQTGKTVSDVALSVCHH